MLRLVINDLKKWKNSRRRKPLILQGARQVGKTWLMKEFGRTEYKKYAYITCEDNPILKAAFDLPFDTERILDALQSECGFKITAGDTLIIFDEIQEIPRALTSLKYFYENAPQYHIVCAGSLLGIALHQGTSFPVGKVNFLNVYPLSFAEFLDACGKSELAALITNKNQDTSLLTTLKQNYIDFLKLYYFIGGMPEAVATWIETRDFSEVREVQKEILTAYEQDISKHVPNEMASKIKYVWQSIPSQLAKENKKFVYGVVREGARAREYEAAITWLSDCALVHKIYRTKKIGYPLKAYQDMSAFKLYINDVGLLGALSNLDVHTFIEGNRLFTEFKGALTEQFVCQEMKAATGIDLYYWSAENAMAEIDFIIQQNENIVPIEVKAETNLQAKSLKSYISRYSPNYAIRFSLADYKAEEIIRNIPLYDVTAFEFLEKNM